MLTELAWFLVGLFTYHIFINKLVNNAAFQKIMSKRNKNAKNKNE